MRQSHNTTAPTARLDPGRSVRAVVALRATKTLTADPRSAKGSTFLRTTSVACLIPYDQVDVDEIADKLHEAVQEMLGWKTPSEKLAKPLEFAGDALIP